MECAVAQHSITNKQNTHLWIAVAPGLDDCVYYIPLPHLHLNLVSYFVYIHTSECVWLLFLLSLVVWSWYARARSPCAYTVWLCIYAYSSIRFDHIWCAILGHTVCRSEDATRRRYNGFIFLFSFFSFWTCVLCVCMCLSGFDRHSFLTLRIVHSFTCTSHSLYRTILIHLPFHFRLWLFINKLVLFNSKFNESNRIVFFFFFFVVSSRVLISFLLLSHTLTNLDDVALKSDQMRWWCVRANAWFFCIVSSTVWRIRYHINTGVITPKLNSLLSINFFISCLSRYPA